MKAARDGTLQRVRIPEPLEEASSQPSWILVGVSPERGERHFHEVHGASGEKHPSGQILGGQGAKD